MSIRIVLADDHAMVRDGLQVLLESQADLTVVAAVADGRAALGAARQLQPDVVVLDIAMPEMNGIEAARRIGETVPSARSLIVSMHSGSEHIYRALQAGARGYLLKESAGAELVAAVRAVHGGHRYLSERINDMVISEYLDERRTGPLDSLSRRERDILQLIVEGHSNSEAAGILCLSVKTVETYRSRMMQKLGLSDLPALVKFAIEHGLTQLR